MVEQAVPLVGRVRLPRTSSTLGTERASATVCATFSTSPVAAATCTLKSLVTEADPRVSVAVRTTSTALSGGKTDPSAPTMSHREVDHAMVDVPLAPTVGRVRSSVTFEMSPRLRASASAASVGPLTSSASSSISGSARTRS